MHKVVVLGTGPAGLTAAIYLARANMEPLVIEGTEPGGQLTLTTEVENFPGFPQGIMGPELMDNMRKQAERFGAKFQTGWVTKADLSKRPFTLSGEGMGELQTESLIISTGASAKLLEIPGEKENIGRGVSTCATCDGFFFRNKKIIVVGGGDSAMEEANFLTKFASEVRVVHRRNELRASKIMQDRAKNNSKITWSLNQTPIEVIASEKGVTGLKVRNQETGEENVLETDGIFVAIGHRPNTAFLDGQIETDHHGYIVVKPGTTETSVPGVFACGDVQDQKYRQAITAAGTGCMAALDSERFLEGSATKDWSMSLNEEVPKQLEKRYQSLHVDKVFIGGAADVGDMVKNENVSVVVDLRGEATEPAFSNPDVHWIQIPLGDQVEGDQSQLFQQAIDSVLSEYQKGNKVAIHCNGGKGRTGAVAAGVLLKLGLAETLEEAEEKVRQIRSVVQIKPAQKEALERLFSK